MDTPEAVDLIAEIADRFPTLKGVIDRLREPDPRDGWKIDAFMSRLNVLSPGERQARLFIANVWNPGYAKKKRWRFDFIEAFPSWDSHHRYAFMVWAGDPRWP